ncbi:Alpha/beta hydrolase fold-3 [Beauveria brongniartii RCEF 3172]|uniref:Alpha/beta hydrolase fold-3 n=1 Tax=Beauveria brongniartii RCEF 3172 TaxID=1081107 RepID=A0A167ILQ0_9HYPO|nr:Alpha/beta hydrolase fold-3 [Beauveria brongniartii RCEF 3172]
MITDQDIDQIGARPLTAGDWFKVVGIMAIYPIIFLYQFAKFFLPCHPQHDFHWRQRTILAAIRTSNVFQSQKRIVYAAGHTKTTSERVRGYAAKRDGIKHREVSVPINAAATAANPATGRATSSPTLHFFSGPWLAGEPGNDDDEDDHGRGGGPVIVYAHGGGYVEPIAPSAHVALARSMAKACGARQVVFIAYALCPDAQYPTQLVQIVESVRFLLEQEDVPPADLVLAGDSAGAHMMASLLAHIAAPAPYVPPLRPSGQFLAVVLLSPWFTWTDAASLGTSTCDYLEGPHTAHLVRVLRPRVEDVWCEIVAAPNAREVWARVFGVGASGEKPLVKRLLVTASDSEIMHRDARVFAVDYVGATSVSVGADDSETQFARVRSETRAFAVGRRETHVQPGLDEAVRYYGGGTWRALQAFMSSLRD